MPAKSVARSGKKGSVVAIAGHPDKKELLARYSQMCLLRRFEERAAALYQQAAIAGFLHLYIGQEAVVSGALSAADPADEIITSYRCHGHALACGVPPEEVMAELMGRRGGVAKGKGGSMHMFSPERHFWGGHGIVAAQVPLGTGIAFALKYKKSRNACLTFIGDGAMNGGQVFESFNMAALWQLPVLYMIENNQYGMGTSVERAAAGELYKRGEPFGIPGQQVNGMDFFAVREAVAEALASIRAGGGPQILEVMTYRYRGHSMSDPGKYRTREEVDEMREKHDALRTMATKLKKEHGFTEKELAASDDKAKKAVEKAEKAAFASPEPGADELFEDIYSS